MQMGTISWYKGFWVGFGQAMKALHCGAKVLQRILDEEQIYVLRITANRHVWRFISPDDFIRLRLKHGSEIAKERRMKAWRGKPNPSQLSMTCPHCGKRGRMYRQTKHTTAGNTVLQCGYCRRTRTLNSTRRPPLDSTCPQCGQTTRQTRSGITSAGNRAVRCAHCSKNYTLKGDPEYVAPPGPTEWEIDQDWRRVLADEETFADRLAADIKA